MSKTEAKIREKKYLYWLCHVPGFGAVKIKKIWEQIGSFEDIYYMKGKDFYENGMINHKEIGIFDQYKKQMECCFKEYDSLAARGIRFVTPLDREYPKRLKMIHDYPMGLFVKGELPKEQVPTAAIIGARNCTNYGLQTAEYISNILSRKGIQIISGLAYGIDSAGHRGAVKGNGKTYGILGCGIDICYPKENYALYEAVSLQGGIITEFMPGERPLPKHFPMRNRIISGLSDVILVIEAKEKSGSLITVDLGLEQGKEVYALPGRITDPLSAGCNQLIRAGAGILTSPYDILEYFNIKYGKMIIDHEKNNNVLAKKEKMVYSCLDLEPKFLEVIVKESGLSVSECMSILLELELDGRIVQTSHQYYGKAL